MSPIYIQIYRFGFRLGVLGAAAVIAFKKDMWTEGYVDGRVWGRKGMGTEGGSEARRKQDGSSRTTRSLLKSLYNMYYK